MLAEAREALEKFVAHRPVDAEGLYYLGKVLKAQGESDKARETFRQAVESAQNSPDYRRRELRYWSKLAQKEIWKFSHEQTRKNTNQKTKSFFCKFLFRAFLCLFVAKSFFRIQL